MFSKTPRGKSKNQPNDMRLLPKKVQFLGHVVNKKALEADPEKIEAVQKFPIPQIQKDVKFFVRRCSCYTWNIKNFAMIARPLHKASENMSSIARTEETHEAFESLRKLLSSTQIRDFADANRPIHIVHRRKIKSSASSITSSAGRKTRVFSKSQANYSATEKRNFSDCIFHTALHRPK